MLFLQKEGTFLFYKTEYVAGGLKRMLSARVEKVKSDPLNLLVNTDVGKQIDVI